MLRQTSRVGYSWMTGSIHPDEAQRYCNLTFVISTRFREICFLEAYGRAQSCRFRWRALSVTWRSSKRFSAQPNPVSGRNRQSPGYKADLDRPRYSTFVSRKRRLQPLPALTRHGRQRLEPSLTVEPSSDLTTQVS